MLVRQTSFRRNEKIAHAFPSTLVPVQRAPPKVSRSFNRDKSPRRDAFPPLLSGSRKHRRQSELQIEKYIIQVQVATLMRKFKFFIVSLLQISEHIEFVL